MEVNNNKEINQMFGTEDDPVVPPAEPELKSSPLGSEPDSSPFQDKSLGAADLNGLGGAAGFGGGLADSADGMVGYIGNDQLDDDSPASYINDTGFVIGDHNSGFRTAFGEGRTIGLKLTLILVPLMLIIGFAGGAIACYSYFFGLHLSAEDSAARTAMSAITEEFSDNNVIFADIYVNNQTSVFDCIVFTLIEHSPVDFRTQTFLVAVSKDGGEVSIMRSFDRDEVDRLRSSGNPQDLVQAEILLSRKHDFEEMLNEIQNGDKHWKQINPLFLSIKLIKQEN
jgi:hypothetical protein